ncbi:MAG: beta-ketoacyl-ACP synthase III [Burkholderiaceae bacterium]|jgi:beta-ketodecanoyl-[acyl-carrier-protein] synthase|nr:beta-ketoacyl-ACP synthase III [Burkholderiaceae bacterium]MCZ8175528.1 beta-ketoacyl-ACP synthase III [Burkholderiaceae bacterium]
MKNVVISGTGLFTPPHVITNEELVASFNAYADLQNAQHAAAIAAGERAAITHSSVEFIEKASGIRQRYVLEKDGVLDPARMKPRFAPRPDEALSLMAEIAVDAGAKAIAAAGLQPGQIDAVLCAAANMQRAYPAMACEIQAALGCGGYGFDMNVACSSATFALQQAVDAVRNGSATRVLIVNPEITSAHLEWRDRDCHFIFGDVCTALVVEAEDTAVGAERWRVRGTRLLTQYSNHIRNNAGFINRCEDTDPDARDKTFMQEGRKVFKEVVPMAAEHIERHLHALGLEPTGVRRFWLHQANLGMNQLVIRKLVGADLSGTQGHDLAPIILGEYANTASAGSIIAFHKHRADLRAGDVGVICSFGAGYSIGSVVVQRL